MTSMSSPIPREAVPFQGREAGLVTRATAATIDAAVVGLALLVSYGLLSGAILVLDPRSFSFPDFSALFTLTVMFWYAVVYLTVAWWTAGRTLGCTLMGLRVVNRRGENPSLLAALVRAITCTLIPIGLVWCAVSPRSRSVQDILVGTSVIYDWRQHDHH